MTRILVTPHQLHNLAQTLRARSSDITEMMKQLQRTYNSLDLETHDLSRLEMDYALAGGKAAQVADQLLTMSGFVERKARDFEQAEQESDSGWPSAPPAPGNWPPASPGQQPWPFGSWPQLGLPNVSDLERVGLTLLVLPPLILDLAMDEIPLMGGLTVGDVKDSRDSVLGQHYMDQMSVDFAAYRQAQRDHGYYSPAAATAYAKYQDGLTHMPILGPWFEAQFKIDRIWGIERGGPAAPPQGGAD